MASNNKLVIAIFIIPVLIFVGILFININKPPASSPLHPGVDQEFSSGNYNFSANEAPAFNFPSVAYASDLQKNVSIYDANGEKINADITASETENGSSIQINRTRQFLPGKYSLVLNQNGRQIKQDFTWGVLAINPNKSVYSVGEFAKLSIAVLDETGAMVCDANVTLDIKDPLGQTTTLTTQSGTIIVNPECVQKKYTVNPDFETKYQVKSLGIYQMNLTAITKNGTYNITDSFSANSDVRFDIERTAATRIFPYSMYPVSIKITAKEDFEGQIKELAPLRFDISPLSTTKAYNDIQKADNALYILWDVSLKKGESINIGYNFKAPLISPQFYLLGPLSLTSNGQSVFEENRSWQLAIDSIEYSTTILNTSGLVSYWRLGESAGINANDAQGTNDGTYTGGYTLSQTGAITDDTDTAVLVNGTTGYVRVPDAASLDLGNGPLSVEMWFRRTGRFSVNYAYLISKGNQLALEFWSSNILTWDQDGAVAAQTTTTFPSTDTSWHHVVATHDASAGQNNHIYIDGSDVTTANANVTFSTNAIDLFIGVESDLVNFFQGDIDEVAIYNVALPAVTVLDHYNQGVALNPTPTPTPTPTSTPTPTPTPGAGNFQFNGLQLNGVRLN